MNEPLAAIQAGPVEFWLTSQDAALIKSLSTLFPTTSGKAIHRIEINLDQPLPGMDWSLASVAKSDPSSLLGWLFTQVYATFNEHLWIDASSLINEWGQAWMIAGPSHAGKSTLTVAAAVNGRHKILSEDVTFVSSKTNLLQCVPLPVSLRPGARERIEKATRKNVPPMLFDEWLFSAPMYAKNGMTSGLYAIVVLDEITADKQPPLSVSTIDTSECMRKLLRLSNALRLEHGMTALSRLFQDCPKYAISGGTLEERLNWLLLES